MKVLVLFASAAAALATTAAIGDIPHNSAMAGRTDVAPGVAQRVAYQAAPTCTDSQMIIARLNAIRSQIATLMIDINVRRADLSMLLVQRNVLLAQNTGAMTPAGHAALANQIATTNNHIDAVNARIANDQAAINALKTQYTDLEQRLHNEQQRRRC